MNKKIYKFALSILVIVMLSGCNSAEDEAKKLGFDDVQDMLSKHLQGWHTKDKFYEDNYKAQGYTSAANMKAANEEALKERAKQDQINKEYEENQKNKTAITNNEQTKEPARVQTSNEYWMFFSCESIQGTNAGESMAQALIQGSMNSPYAFSSMMSGATYRKYCSPQGGYVTAQKVISTLERVGSNGEGEYYIGYIGDALMGNQVFIGVIRKHQ